jgi:hypothetical protein
MGRFRRARDPVASMASSFSSGSTAQADFGDRRFPASDPRRHAAETLCRPERDLPSAELGAAYKAGIENTQPK